MSVNITAEQSSQEVEIIVSQVVGISEHSQLNLDDGTNPHGTTKSDVGLGNVDNTSDLDKPVSIAQNDAIIQISFLSIDTVDYIKRVIADGGQVFQTREEILNNLLNLM